MADQLLATLFEEAGIALCLLGPDGRVVMANAEWLRSTGMAAHQIVGVDLRELFPGTRELAASVEARVLSGETVRVPRHYEQILGRDSWWEGTISPVAMPQGMGVLISAHEVTSQVLAEREREQLLDELKDVNWHLVLASARHRNLAQGSESQRVRLMGLLESITDGFFALDRKWEFTYVNSEAEKAFQKKQADLLGRDIWGESLEIAGPTFVHELRKSMEEARPVTFEEYHPLVGKWFEVSAYPTLEGLSVHFHEVASSNPRGRSGETPIDVLAGLIREQLELIQERAWRLRQRSDLPEELLDHTAALLDSVGQIDRILRRQVEPAVPGMDPQTPQSAGIE